MISNNAVIADIDGCLTDYPSVFLSWIAECKGISVHSLEGLKAAMSRDDYENLKHSYRMSGVKRSLPVSPGAREAFEQIKQNGVKVWIVTRRPNWEPVLSDTEYWLNANNLLHDKLFFVNDKRAFIEQHLDWGIRAVIDDDYEVAEFVSRNLDVCVLYFNTEQRVVTDEKIVAVNSWEEVQSYLTKLSEEESWSKSKP